MSDRRHRGITESENQHFEALSKVERLEKTLRETRAERDRISRNEDALRAANAKLTAERDEAQADAAAGWKAAEDRRVQFTQADIARDNAERERDYYLREVGTLRAALADMTAQRDARLTVQDVAWYLLWERGEVTTYDVMYAAQGRAHDRVSDALRTHARKEG